MHCGAEKIGSDHQPATDASMDRSDVDASVESMEVEQSAIVSESIIPEIHDAAPAGIINVINIDHFDQPTIASALYANEKHGAAELSANTVATDASAGIVNIKQPTIASAEIEASANDALVDDVDAPVEPMDVEDSVIASIVHIPEEPGASGAAKLVAASVNGILIDALAGIINIEQPTIASVENIPPANESAERLDVDELEDSPIVSNIARKSGAAIATLNSFDPFRRLTDQPFGRKRSNSMFDLRRPSLWDMEHAIIEVEEPE